MKKLVMFALISLLSVSANAKSPKLSKDCIKALDNSIYYAHEQQKIAIQFGTSLDNANLALENAVNFCVELALYKKNYSEEKKARVSKMVSTLAVQYIND
jgi:hypothetical protein